MTYVVRLNDRVWLLSADFEGAGEEVRGTANPDDAAQFATAELATAEILRVPAGRPLDKADEYRLRRPLYDAKARIQELEQARAEARGEEV